MFEHPAVFDDFLSGKLPANCSVQRSGLQLLLCRQPIQGDTCVSNRRGISSVSSNCSPRWLRKATKTNQVAFPSSVQIGQEKCAHFLGAYFFSFTLDEFIRVCRSRNRITFQGEKFQLTIQNQ